MSSNKQQIDQFLRRMNYIANLTPEDHSGQPRLLEFDTLLQMDQAPGVSLAEKLTDTIRMQSEVESTIQDIYDDVLEAGSDKFPTLHRKDHIRMVNSALTHRLPGFFAVLDASHPWTIYWLMNAASLLGVQFDDKFKKEAAECILSYIWEDGPDMAIGGGYSQLPHMAAFYAAILALALSGDEEAWARLDRQKVRHWLGGVKREDGSFAMLAGGECDTRAVYCALSVASLLDILDDELASGVADWLARCQTYEGGFGGEPGDEAHAGYTFCAVAALCILMPPEKVASVINVDSLLRWTVHRQYALEGGLSGRSNKLVDACYSQWVGGMAALLECITGQRHVLNRMVLQNYLLCCCQGEKGGMRDKPGKTPDFYHTNYALCGFSMCHYYQVYNESVGKEQGYAYGYQQLEIADSEVIDNLEENRILPLDPVFVLPPGYALKMRDYYRKK